MKTNHPFTLIVAGLAAMLGAPARAIEPPADDATPPRVVQPAPDAPPAKLPPATAEAPLPIAPPPVPGTPAPDATAVKARPAFLGVVCMPLPDMLVDHLGLKKDGGIVVQALCPPDGPAAKAGVAVNDVITRIGEQAVTSPADLTKWVTSHQPGDKIHLDVIHHGKPAGLDVTLGAKPDDLAALNPNGLDQLNLEGMPKELADRVRRAIEGNIGGIDMDAVAPPDAAPKIQELKMRMGKAMGNLNGLNIVPKIEIQQGASFRMMDEQGSIELKSNDGDKEVTLRDKDNKVVWSGPWDTDQDKAAAPEDVRKRIEHLHLDTNFHGNGLRLQLGAPPAGDAP